MTTTRTSPPQTERQRGTAPLSPNGGSAHELSAELARLRERFVAYERLDRQLDEMVTGLTDLLRGATELRRRTNQDIAAAIARCEELIVADHAHHRDTLSSLLADLDAAQHRTATVTTAVAKLQTELADITRRLPGSQDPTAGTPSDLRPPPSAPTALALAIRDVPNVATALTLQRFIAGLPPVTAIQTREFAAGELRLHLDLAKPFAVAELAGLPHGSLDVIEDRPDRLVLRYVPPDAA
jgi:hypothetical protein